MILSIGIVKICKMHFSSRVFSFSLKSKGAFSSYIVYFV